MESFYTLDFLLITINGRKDPRPPLLVGCGQLYLSPNRIVGFFDRQYLGKESINTLDFLLGDNDQQKK